MASKLDIINRALAHCKSDPIPDTTALTTNNLAEARQANTHWQSTYEEILRMHPWNRAMKEKDLGNPDSSNPLLRYSFRYKLPGDCLRVFTLNEIDPPNESHHYWTIRADNNGVYLHTDETSAIIEYTFTQEVGRLDSLCASCIEFLLASKIAFPLTGSRSRAAEILQAYTKLIRPLARSVDGMEDNPEPRNNRRHSKWRRSRYVSTNG
jgi:hypothetical protein